MADSAVDFKPDHPGAKDILTASDDEAVVVGLYGIPGSGKTTLMKQLKEHLKKNRFALYEGSQVIADIVPGGLDTFEKLEEEEKIRWRELAIAQIKKDSKEAGQVAVVTGHFMFWPEEEDAGTPVYTQSDLNIYSHIIYLEIPAEKISEYRQADKERTRPFSSVFHLQRWQEAEKTQLRHLCRHHNILFSVVSPRLSLLDTVVTLLHDFEQHKQGANLGYAEYWLDEAIMSIKGQPKTVLVMDADRTLVAEDTGKLFWKRVPSFRRPTNQENPLKGLFSGPMGYSYNAFRQAALMYQEAANDEEFDAYCADVASAVTMHPEFVSLLHMVAGQESIAAVVITCGLRFLWQKILEKEGLSKTATVIGGGSLADDLIVTGPVKAALVSRLQDFHNVDVWAFGDSVLDLDMLKKADHAIIVVGDEDKRSQMMDAALLNAIDNDGLRARQVLLPKDALPRLNITKLPVVDITRQDFVDAIFCKCNRHTTIDVVHATDKNAAKLLMTPMRDATYAGPALRGAHRSVGWYLATEFLADTIGVEGFNVTHVQGHITSGYRLLHEDKTTIVALMRGGEPMALGVSDAFPLAMFVHASTPSDLRLHHLEGQTTVMLVDSVVNSGKTLMQFIRHIRTLHATIRIVAVVGVIQAKCISDGFLAQAIAHHAKITIVTLRISDNQFTGARSTDTGNRLFNTTHLL